MTDLQKSDNTRQAIELQLVIGYDVSRCLHMHVDIVLQEKECVYCVMY